MKGGGGRGEGGEGRGEGGVESGRRGRIRRVLSMQSHRTDPATVWRQNEIRRKESMVVVNHNWNNSQYTSAPLPWLPWLPWLPQTECL